jgi:hypothetical protein
LIINEKLFEFLTKNKIAAQFFNNYIQEQFQMRIQEDRNPLLLKIDLKKATQLAFYKINKNTVRILEGKIYKFPHSIPEKKIQACIIEPEADRDLYLERMKKGTTSNAAGINDPANIKKLWEKTDKEGSEPKPDIKLPGSSGLDKNATQSTGKSRLLIEVTECVSASTNNCDIYCRKL